MSSSLAAPAPSTVRPIDPALHPIETGSYRIATPAIQAFSDLITRCLRYRITGALTYGPSRIGKTPAIEYLRLLLAETHPKIVTYHAQAEHKPRHAEGPFFANLLQAVGYPEPDSGSNPAKRMRLINKIKEACSRNGSGTVVLFCDEAQRYDENEYEWLRDVHDHLDRLQIRLFTFLVGQQELLAVKTSLQQAKKTQIVARLMVEELAFFGIRNVRDVATCLDGYDRAHFPRASGWRFTRFYLAQAVTGGYRLTDDAPILWTAFEQLHHKHGLSGELEIPMESFTRAVEIVLKEGELRDAPGVPAGCGAVGRSGTQLRLHPVAPSRQPGVDDRPRLAAVSSLPILTFDERVLNPRLGYVFDRRWLDPYESIVGMLWKFVRMNGIAGHVVVTQLCRHVDPYEGVAPTPKDVDVRGLARMLGVTQSSVRAGLYSPASAHRGSLSFRYCTRCLSRGYHGASHQYERLLSCPAHSSPLETRCRHCQRTSDYRLDAQLLDTPFRCRHCTQNYAAVRPMNIALRSPMAMKDRVAIPRSPGLRRIRSAIKESRPQK